MAKHKEAIGEITTIDPENPVGGEAPETETVYESAAMIGSAVERKIEALMPPPRITDKVIFTDNYPQGYGKKLTAFIMAVDDNWVAHLATLDPTQNPLCHPRPGVPYDQSGRPGSWAFLLEK